MSFQEKLGGKIPVLNAQVTFMSAGIVNFTTLRPTTNVGSQALSGLLTKKKGTFATISPLLKRQENQRRQKP